MKVGYFKVQPAVPAVRAETRVVLWRPLVTLPATGLVLALVLVGSMQLGAKLNNFNLPLDRYRPVISVALPDNVYFLANVYDSLVNFKTGLVDWSFDTWGSFIANWRVFLGLDSTPIILSTPTPTPVVTVELQEQIRQQILAELRAEQASTTQTFGGVVPADKPVYAVTAVPAGGTTLTGEALKQNLQQVFADQVDIKFESNGQAGTITPIFQDGRRGKAYVFVLTPTR